MRTTPARGLTIRTALLLGFGLTLAVWALAGYRFTQQVAAGEARAAAISTRYVRAQTLLAKMREDVLFIAITLREALVESNVDALRSQRAQLESASREVDVAVGQYQPVMDSALERRGIERLRRELDALRTTMAEVLHGLDSGWSDAERLALRDRIGPHRESVVHAADEVQAMNRLAYIEQQSGVATVYRSIQRPLWQILGAALLLTLAIALWSTRHASRLEQRVVQQAARESRAADELQRLSSQLLSAQEAERRTIARELHDEVGQVLTAIKMELTVAEHALRAGQETAQPFDRVRRITEGALQSVRDLSHVLHPAMLDDFGLPEAVEWYVRGVARRSGLDIELHHEGMDERLAPEIEVTVYRIVQEGLTNVVKHAQATTVRVSLTRAGERIRLRLEDDGIGFDMHARRTRADAGLGLIGIRERVSQFGGHLDVETAPGHGTRLAIDLPARPRPAVDEAVPMPVTHLSAETIRG